MTLKQSLNCKRVWKKHLKSSLCNNAVDPLTLLNNWRLGLLSGNPALQPSEWGEAVPVHYACCFLGLAHIDKQNIVITSCTHCSFNFGCSATRSRRLHHYAWDVGNLPYPFLTELWITGNFSEFRKPFAGLLQVHWMLVLVACYHQRARVAEGRQTHKEAVDEVSQKLTRTPQMLSGCCQFDFSLKIIIHSWDDYPDSCNSISLRTIGYWGFDWVLHSMLDTCCNMLPLVCPSSLLWAPWKYGVHTLPAMLRFQRCSLTLGSVPSTHPMIADFFLSCPDSQFSQTSKCHDVLVGMNYVASSCTDQGR